MTLKTIRHDFGDDGISKMDNTCNSEATDYSSNQHCRIAKSPKELQARELYQMEGANEYENKLTWAQQKRTEEVSMNDERK